TPTIAPYDILVTVLAIAPSDDKSCFFIALANPVVDFTEIHCRCRTSCHNSIVMLQVARYSLYFYLRQQTGGT
uniref:hypothetical protein n=1 Tax=Segatella hominis TaxID=2518605 RepID=UPI0040388E4D